MKCALIKVWPAGYDNKCLVKAYKIEFLLTVIVLTMILRGIDLKFLYTSVLTVIVCSTVILVDYSW